MGLFFYETKIGKIGIKEVDGFITNVYLNSNFSYKEDELLETELIKEASKQLEQYLNGNIKKFNLPLKVDGTEFMEEVWLEICKIPYGKILSYKGLAEKIGRPKSARAIGMACNKNPIPIFIPCHRIVGSNGHLTGYSGGLNIKEILLSLESKKRII